MSLTIYVLVAVLALLTPQNLDEKILEVRVNSPHHCLSTKITLDVRELTTHEIWSIKDLSAGHPVRFQLPSGKYLLRISGKEIATCFAGPVQLDDFRVKERLTVNLEKGARLSGTVRDDRGKPLQGARVFLKGGLNLPDQTVNPFLPDGLRLSVLHSNMSVMMGSITDGEGKFLLDDIPPSKAGDYRIHIEKTGFRRAYRLPESSIVIRPGMEIQRDWILERGEPSIVIELSDSEGHPVKDGWISWMNSRVNLISAGFEDYVGLPCRAGPSGADGKIEIIDPQSGIQDYWIVVKGYEWSEIKSSPGDVRKVELTKTSGKMEVHVVDAENGQFLPNAQIQVNTLTLFQTPFEISMKETGVFLIKGEFKRFPLSIRAWSEDRPSTHTALMLGPKELNSFKHFPFYKNARPEDFKYSSRNSELEEEARSGCLKIELRKGISFSIHVLGKGDIPLDGFNANVDLRSETSGYIGIRGRRLSVTQIAPAEARIDVQGLEPGTLKVFFSAPHYLSGSEEFKIKEDGQKGTIILAPAACE